MKRNQQLLGNEPGTSDYRYSTKLGSLSSGVGPEPTKYLVIDKIPSGNNHPLHACCGHTILGLTGVW